ncbi:hypothetical protein Tco_0935337 [Tanacetum coccineum]
MSNLKFAETHNLVAFLEKPEETDGFEGIIDFLNASSIRYALTVNPTIYTSCIKQIWATAKAKTVNGEWFTVFTVWLPYEEHVPTHYNDPLFSGEDRLQLKELLELYTKLSARVLDLENTKTSHSAEITNIKGMGQGYRKIGRTARIESSKDEGLGAQKDASKQGRKIVDLDADAEVTLVDEAQERNDDNLMFDTGVFDEQEVKVEKVVSTAEVTTASATTIIVDELTLAQTLIEIKAAKPKAVTTVATTTTTVVTRPKASGVVVQEPSEFTTTTSQPSQFPEAKDKGKAKMIEPEKPLKKKDQNLIDEEIAQKLQAQLNAELEKEKEKLAKQREEDAKTAEWDNVQATIDADYELAARLQAQEQEELTVE